MNTPWFDGTNFCIHDDDGNLLRSLQSADEEFGATIALMFGAAPELALCLQWEDPRPPGPVSS